VQVVPVERDQPRRRLRERALSPQVIIGVAGLVLGIVLVRGVGDYRLGPGSSAVIALLVFGGMLAATVLRRRVNRRLDAATLDGDVVED
jgi:hypothetical protein